MNAILAGLKTGWKYLAWTAAGAAVVAAFDPAFLASISVPVMVVPVLALIGKSLATYITVQIQETMP